MPSHPPVAPSGSRRVARPRIAPAAIPLAVLLTACNFGAPDPKSQQGQEIFDLYRFFVWTAIGVGGITYALILWSAIRYRRRSDALPKQTRDHIPIEITYTVIPLVIVIVLFVATIRTEIRVEDQAHDPPVTVDVTGFQWQWRFEYPDYGFSVVGTASEPPTMVVPAGQTVRIRLRADDVIHSFYVPEFMFKRDAIPGMDNAFDFVAPEPGRFRGECAEYCGLDHAAMTFFVEAVSPDAFGAWAAQRAAEASA
jgi:cytochrome c oxidase subunit 2